MFYERILAPTSILALALLARPTETGPLSSDARLVSDAVGRWNDAYRRMDAGALASLEAADIEIVDRFGTLHRPAGGSARRRLWTDAFEQLERNSFAPEFAVEPIHFLRVGVALVRVRVDHRNGIGLVDGARIPAHSEIHSLLMVAIHGDWSVASVSMQDITRVDSAPGLGLP